MKIKLPLGKSPLLCYPNYADIFSILDAYSSDYQEWIYNYFIQLTVPKDHELGHRLDFSVPRLLESLPWLNAERIERKLSMDICSGSYVQFLINAISRGKYIFTLLDTYYNHNYSSYQKEHYPHEHLIYGYDDEKRIFLFADNFNMGKYAYGVMTFKEAENANSGLIEEGMTDWYDGTYLLSYRKQYDYGMCVFKDYYKHVFNLKVSYKLLNDYLLKRPTEFDWTLPNSLASKDSKIYGKCWGMGIYNYMNEYIDIIERNKRQDIDFRFFYVLYEHKKLMKEIVRYILNITGGTFSEAIQEKCNNNIRDSDLIIKMLLIYSFKAEFSLLRQIKKRIQILHDGDYAVMEYLCNEINKAI